MKMVTLTPQAVRAVASLLVEAEAGVQKKQLLKQRTRGKDGADRRKLTKALLNMRLQIRAQVDVGEEDLGRVIDNDFLFADFVLVKKID